MRIKLAFWIIALWAALVAATADGCGDRHTVQCAGGRQEVLASSSSLLQDRRALTYEVTRLKEALEDAQQGNLRLSEKHSDVLREHLQVLGDLQLLRQERAALQQERALLHEKQVTLLAEQEDLRQDHAALLHKHEALLQVHGSLQRQHETLRTDHAGLTEDQRDLEAAHGSLKKSYRGVHQDLHSLRELHDRLRQDHLRLQDTKESLLDDMDEMATTNHQMAEGMKNIIEECQRTQEETKLHAQSLVLRKANEKERALMEAQEKYDRLMEERNAMEEQLAIMKKNNERAEKEMTEIAETEKQVVNAARTARHEWYKTKETVLQHIESLEVKVEIEKKKLMHDAEQKESLSMIDTVAEKETHETEKRSQEHEGGFHQPNDNLVPGEQGQESRESSQQASEHAERLANAVNEQMWKQERLLLGLEKNDTKEGDATQEKKPQRRIRERNEL